MSPARAPALLAAVALLAASAAGQGPSAGASPAPQGTMPGSPPPAASPRSLRPHIVKWLIPFPQSRKRQMVAYSERHYGQRTYRLTDPHVIVEHYADAPTAQSVYNTFAPDQPDSELHELPGLCSHFVVDRDGTIYQLVPLNIRCRHTVGLDWTAIGIEHVGSSDAQILSDHRQLHASLRLTRWLRCSRRIRVRNVIGHAESLRSPYHHERVPSLRNQTHGDWRHADMVRYRRMLAALPCR